MRVITRPAGVAGRQSKGNKVSVEDQIRAGHRVCEAENWPVHRDYRDLVSASRFGTKQRDEWPQLLADVAAGRLGVVVLWDSSRGDRKPAAWTAFLEDCRRTGTAIYLIRDERLYDLDRPADWKAMHDAGTSAGYDSEVRSADTRRGTAEAALAGKPHGRVRFGFTRHYDPHNRKVFEDRPNENAAVAAEIITRISKRVPVSALVNDLNQRQAGGRTWSRKAVKLLATNHAYAGLRSHNGDLHPAAWPAIVDEDVFWRAQAVLSEPGRRQAAPGRHKFLLSYLMSCGVCEDPSATVNVNAYLARARPRYKCAAKGCVSIGKWEADEYAIRLVLGRLSRPDARDLFATSGKELTAAKAEVARLERQLEEARVSFEGPDGISAAALARKERALEGPLERARSRVQGAQRADAVLDLLGAGEFTEEVGRPRWEALSVPARRAVLKSLFERIELAPTDHRLSAHATEDDRLELAAERITVAWRGAAVSRR